MNRIEQVCKFAEERDADLSIQRGHPADGGPGVWSVMLTWGREAPDSPMAAAQSLGLAETLEEAIEQVATELRLPALCKVCGGEIDGDLGGDQCDPTGCPGT